MAYDPTLEPATPDLAPRRRRWIGPLLLALIAFGAGLLAMEYVLTHSDAAARFLRPARTVTVVKPVRVPVRVAGPPAPPAVAVDVRLGRLERAVGTIASRAQAASGDADRAEGLLLAFAARRALDRGIPLGYIEGLLRERFGGGQPEAVAIVIAAAHQPVTLADLQAGLDRIGPALVDAGSAPRTSWWTGLRRELDSLVVLRRADAPPTTPEERLDRADAELAAGHADRALAEIARLPSRNLAAGWIAAARRYVAARNALDILETAALLAPRRPEPVAPVADAAPPTG